MTVTFDLDHEFRQKHDSEVFFGWLADYVQHKALVFRTEGDDRLEDGTIVPWRESEWTSTLAEYDLSNPILRPGGHCFRWPGWQAQEYHLIRVLFSDVKEARHFALEFQLKPESVDNSTF